MLEWGDATLSSSQIVPAWSIPAIILALAVALEMMIAVPKRAHPLAWYYAFCHKIPQAVKHVSSSLLPSIGILLWLMFLLTIVGTLAIFKQLAAYPAFFDLLMLWLSISTLSAQRISQRVYQSLLQEKKQLAKEILQPYVLRDTQPLSPLGVGKACVEMRLFTYAYQFMTPLILYSVLNAEVALCYRLTLETMRAWNPKLPTTLRLGEYLRPLCHLMQWPTIALIASLNFLMSPKQTRLAYLRLPKITGSGLLLATCGARIDCQLSGPAQYAGLITRLPRVGSKQDIKIGHLSSISPYILQLNIFLLSVCIGLCLL